MEVKLVIGYQTENNANDLSIDISALKTKFPNATAQLWAVRPGETKLQAYPVPKQAVSGNNLIWTPLAVDVERNGNGEAQVRMYDHTGAEIIEARSEIIPTVIQRSIIPSDLDGDVPTVVAAYEAMITEIENEKEAEFRENASEIIDSLGVDDELDNTSVNPVQNKVIVQEFATLKGILHTIEISGTRLVINSLST